MKLTDFVANFLVEQGIKHVFMLTGGGAMHLNHSLGRHAGLQIVYNHHEQASAMAAESYARLTNKLPVVNVTTGPGGINTLNGVFGAFVDSLPMLVISGQVRFDTTVASTQLPLRQLGDQECQIIEMVKSITKYAVMIRDPDDIQYELQKAIHLAKEGRPGPVWIDIPMNVQGANINPDMLRAFEPTVQHNNLTIASEVISQIMQRIAHAKRPVILAGAGVRLSGQHQNFMALVETLKIPVTTAWNAHDVLYDDHPFHCGKPGSIGDRFGNFTVQNADLLLVLGSRLNIRQISYNHASFARHAYKIMVDIDLAELNKPTLAIDLPVHADLADFMPHLLAEAKLCVQIENEEHKQWLRWCRDKRTQYPVVLPSYWQTETRVNPYCFMHTLSAHLPENQIIVTGDGTACVVSFQAMHLKPGQRLYTNSGCASMGYDLPAAIGACVGSGGQRIVCLAGDGSVMQNIQELATIAFNQYSIVLFILNNNGYHSIRQTQHNFFGEPLIGVGPDSGLGFPDFSKLAQGFGLPYFSCSNHQEMDASLKKVLTMSAPVICEVMLDLAQQFAPKLSSRRLENGQMVTSPLEDMYPFLSREELAENCLFDEEVSI